MSCHLTSCSGAAVFKLTYYYYRLIVFKLTVKAILRLTASGLGVIAGFGTGAGCPEDCGLPLILHSLRDRDNDRVFTPWPWALQDRATQSMALKQFSGT